MTVNVTKPAINVREKLAELDKPTGIAGEAILRAETPQEQFNLIGAGRRNLAINGAMDIWQRGDTFSNLGSNDTYSADRMHSVAYNFSFANATGGQIERSYIYGTKLDGVNFSHALKISPSSTWKITYLDQRVEDVTKFSDVTVTVSYYARANTNLTLQVTPRVNQVFGSGGSATVATYQSTPDYYNLTTEWQRFSYTIHCPSISGKTVGSGSYADFYIYQSADLSGAGWIQITGLQIEYGKVATPFEHRSYGEELALCKRYYQRSELAVGATFSYGEARVGSAQAHNASWVIGNLNGFVQMRSTPSVTNGSHTGATDAVTRSGGASASCNFSGSSMGHVKGFNASSFTANEGVQFTWAADAEL